MNLTSSLPRTLQTSRTGWWMLLAALVVTVAVYWPGLSGGYLFDDYPNIVDNRGVQPDDASFSSLVRAALSSPSSSFKRPLASLSFAANYLVSGLDPYWMKLTNLVIHLLNGLLAFLLARSLLVGARSRAMPLQIPSPEPPIPPESIARERAPTTMAGSTTGRRAGIVAALVAASWMLLPINLTGVLYVVQRMESLANAFVLLGLVGYVAGRQRMLASVPRNSAGAGPSYIRGLLLCFISITLPTALGLLAKETAVMLPLYAALIEWVLFRLAKPEESTAGQPAPTGRDWRVASLFLMVLVVPMIAGLAWILPGLLRPETWAQRDFTLGTRLLSEMRIVVSYIAWTLIPTPGALSFYHDDFVISTGLLRPWTTLASLLTLTGLVALTLWLRKRLPLVALGIALFMGCQLLTGTILRLELIYEHRNYFASFGLLLAIVPLLAAPRDQPFALPRHALLLILLASWTALTAFTAYAWGNPLRLAEDLAIRAPESPRAQYELGRTYIIYSHYDLESPFTKLAYAPLEKAAALPRSSILPEQALIFMNARMKLPIKDAWWESMVTKLAASKPGVQDESSLGALTQCAQQHRCELPPDRMMAAFMAALSHPNPSARLLAAYGDYAWNVLHDRELGERMTREAAEAKPDEPAYQITLVRMLVVMGHTAEAREALGNLQRMNIGGSLDKSLGELRALPGMQ